MFWILLIVPPIAIMLGLFAVQLRTRNAGIADAGWAFCMVWVAAFFAGWEWFQSAEPDAVGRDRFRIMLIGAMGVVWAGRLGLFILFNRVIGRPEDTRYAGIRAARGAGANRFFLVWFLAQIPFSMLFGVCFLAAIRGSGPWIPALVLFIIAVGGELLADAQLAAFRADPKNRGTTCRRGLWRYSRHPNYFFEWLHWFVYVILAWGGGWWFAVSFIGPCLMLFMLFRVSGIPLTEKRSLESRGDDYREYQRTTSVFVPLPPKK